MLIRTQELIVCQNQLVDALAKIRQEWEQAAEGESLSTSMQALVYCSAMLWWRLIFHRWKRSRFSEQSSLENCKASYFPPEQRQDINARPVPAWPNLNFVKGDM